MNQLIIVLSLIAILTTFDGVSSLTVNNVMKKCKNSDTDNVLWVDITGCTFYPCELQSNSYISLEVAFTSKEYSKTLTPKLKAFIKRSQSTVVVSPVLITLELDAPRYLMNLCDHLTYGKCPIQPAEADQYYVLTVPYYIDNQQSDTSIEVSFS